MSVVLMAIIAVALLVLYVRLKLTQSDLCPRCHRYALADIGLMESVVVCERCGWPDQEAV